MAVARSSRPRNRSARRIRRKSPRSFAPGAGKGTRCERFNGAALENQIRKNRVRWLRQTLTDAATQRANELGWPNTYTFTKSLSESLIRNYSRRATRSAAIAVVRPAIVETSIEKPFLGWNEGINTSASLSYLLGTFFRQLPTTESKVSRPDSRGPRLPRHDADRRRARRAPPRARLSAGHFGDESVRHAPFDRTDRLGPSEISIARRMASIIACA